MTRRLRPEHIAAALTAGACAGVAAALAGPAGTEYPVGAFVTILASLVWTVWLLGVGRPRPVRPLLMVTGTVFSLSACASVLVARSPTRFAIDLALAPVLGALVASWARDQRVRKGLMWGLTGLLGLFGLYSLQKWAAGGVAQVTVEEGGQARIFPGSFGHPNQYAAALVLMLPFAAALCTAGAKRNRTLALTCTLLGLFALTLTYSRGAWLAGIVAIVVAVGSRRARWMIVGFGGAVAALLAPSIAERLSPGTLTENVRLDIWERALVVIADNPLLGVGVQNFPYAAADTILPNTADAPPHAHSLLLATASEIGVAAAVALAVGLLAIFVALLRRRRSEGPVGERQQVLACLGAFAAIAVTGSVDAVVYHNVQTLAIAAMVVGLSAALTAPPVRRASSGLRAPEPIGRRQPVGAEVSG